MGTLDNKGRSIGQGAKVREQLQAVNPHSHRREHMRNP